MQYPLKFNAALHIWNRSLLSRVLEHFKNKTLTVWVLPLSLYTKI